MACFHRRSRPLHGLVRASLPLLLALDLGQCLAADAGAGIGGVSITVSDATPDDGVWPWLWIVNNVDWASPASAVQVAAGLTADPATTTAWSGVPLDASATDGTSASASASVGGTALDAGAGASGSAAASATAGDGAWAIAQVFDGRFMVGAGTTVTVTATVSDLFAHADGGFAQALVSLQIAGADGSGPAADQAWIFDTPDFSDINGEETLSVTWTNASSDAVWGNLWITASAQAIAPAPIPEPATAGMLAAGLAVLGCLGRRRSAAAARLFDSD